MAPLFAAERRRQRLVYAAGSAVRLAPGYGNGFGVETGSGEVGGLHIGSQWSFRPAASLKHPSGDLPRRFTKGFIGQLLRRFRLRR